MVSNSSGFSSFTFATSCPLRPLTPSPTDQPAPTDPRRGPCTSTLIPDSQPAKRRRTQNQTLFLTEVVATIPKTLEQVIENAIYLEERAVGVVTDRLKLWDQQHKCNSSDPIELDNCSHATDCIPSTAEAEIYAAGARNGPLQRAPQKRTAFTPEGIQAARMLAPVVEVQQPGAMALDPPLPEPLGQALLPNPIISYHPFGKVNPLHVAQTQQEALTFWPT
ncbi:hypothetical protein WJX79_004603 [Trebouxia sp. C0005]